MHRASRYRLYPNQTQEREFVQLCGAGRFVYNELLAEQEREFARYRAKERKDKPKCSGFDFGRRYVRLKAQEGCSWLRERSSVIVRATGAFQLGSAYSHYFRRLREGQAGKEAGHPRFKARGRCRESFTIPENVTIEKKRLKVPTVGWVRMNRKAQSRTRGEDPWAGGEARTATVVRELGQWYVWVVWDVEDEALRYRGGVCGVDRNAENIAVSWDGQTKILEVPYDQIEKYEARARHYQWRASHRQRSERTDEDGKVVRTKSGKPVRVASKRRAQMHLRAAKATRKAANIRRDFSHQVSAALARNFGHIVVEDLDVAAMRRSARGTREEPGTGVKAKSGLNRKMAQFSCMGMLDRFLQYKGWDILKVPAAYTSQRCAQCGHVEGDNRKGEHFRCRSCGHTDHADANAARNILNLGYEQLLAGGAPVTGRGGDNEAGAFFMECLVETAYDPSKTTTWNYRGSPRDFHTES